MALLKLAQRSLVADQVFDAIHQAIMSGDLPAGARLRIRDLADELGTSPMPVRDSIVRLEQAGLAQRVPHKGAIVTQLTPVSARTWVRRDGLVLRQEIPFPFVKLILERLPDRSGRLEPGGQAP